MDGVTENTESTMKFWLLLILILIHGSLVLANGAQENYLASFRTKLLARLESGPADNRRVAVYEVEEFYDRSRGLGRATVLDSEGERIELLVHLKSKIYFEGQYGVDGDLKRCEVSQKRPLGGNFDLFGPLAAGPKERQELGYIVGPSALLYKFREGLRSKSEARLRSQADSNLDGSKQIDDRRRLMVDPTPLIFQLEDGTEVVFQQSDLPLDRSPLLAELASFLSLTDKNGNSYQIDYLFIESGQFSFSATYDPFKLPSVYSCLSPHLIGEEYQLSSTWARILEIKSNRMSAALSGLSVYPGGAHLALDLGISKFMLRIEGQSRDVFDIRRRLLYSMPENPTPNALSPPTTVADNSTGNIEGTNNGECLVISNNAFNGINSLISIDMESLASLDRWRFFIGNTNSMTYLGRTKYKDRQLVHEFELNYTQSTYLPAYLTILIQQSTWRDLSSVDKSDRLVGKLWLLAESCEDLYSTPQRCKDPTILGLRIDLVNANNQRVKVSESVHFNEFQWDQFDEDGLDESATETFNLRQCFDRKLHLTLETRWSSYKDLDSACSEQIWLDDFVASKLIDHLSNLVGSDLIVTDLQRRSFPGVKKLSYIVELAQEPEQVIAFKLESEQVMRSAMASWPIDQFQAARTQFECLTWAAQFGRAQAVLYSPETGECLVYDNRERKNKIDSSKGTLYAVYGREIEQTSGSHEVLDLFIHDKLDTFNQKVLDLYSKPNEYKACLDDATLVSDLRLGTLKLKVSSVRNRLQGQAPLYKAGYRFIEQNLEFSPDNRVESRQQMEVVSFAQCSSSCDEEPRCSSFSYCHYQESRHEYCQLADFVPRSGENSSTVQSSYLTRDAGCEIYLRDYLANFEPKNVAELTAIELNNIWRPISNVNSELACARSCYLAAEDSCMRLVYCPDLQTKCFHWLNDAGTESNRGKSPLPLSNAALSSCSEFKRKPLTLYKRTMAIKFKTFDWFADGLTRLKVNDMDENECARRCSQDTECQSFDSCTLPISKQPTDHDDETGNSSAILSRRECTLLSYSIYDKQMRLAIDVREGGSRDAEEGSTTKQSDSPHCAHYERLAAQRRLTDMEAKMLIRGLTTGPVTTKPTSYVSILFGASILGLTLGVCANSASTLWKRQTRMQSS